MGYLKRRIIEAMEPKEEPPMEPNTTDTDIVDHLRWLANSATPMDAAAMRLAADEIERLRAKNCRDVTARSKYTSLLWTLFGMAAPPADSQGS